MKSTNKVLAFPHARDRRTRDELAFLPAALEIVETPPSPIGQAIGLTIISLLVLALVWAYFGKIDIVASAPGKIIPSGRVKVVQPFEVGVVRAIHVRDGQTVKAGEVLIELDPTMNEADLNHLKSDLAAAQLDVARLRAALSDAVDPLSAFEAPSGISPALVAVQEHLLVKQREEHLAKLAALDNQRAQKEAERATIAAQIAKLKATIPIIKARVDIRKALVDQQLSSKLTYLENVQALVEQEQDLPVEESRYREADAAVAAIAKSRAETDAEYRRKNLSDLAEAERKAAGLKEDVLKAEQRTKFQNLTAPVDGVVQQLAVHTVGGVVTPAQPLLEVVPADSQLEIEAMVSNRDIGFVHPGQEAEIKVDTFNFTRYGLLRGRVLSVSPDAIVREKPPNGANDGARGANPATSEPKGQELVYSARVSLDRTHMTVDGKPAALSPGMAVTVEIKTGSRTILKYLLSPLLRYKQESLRER